jgi:preprotein translocase subunit SecY
MSFKDMLHNLPEVASPSEKKLGFNVKLKWTIIILISFFILSNITLWGADPGFLSQFEYLAVIMGTNFGSIISLGIGPIVMSSIILQLLVGSGILNIDTSTHEGKKFFQAIQKLGVFFFIIFEAIVYVLMGGIKAVPGFQGIVIAQLIIGGLMILFMDEVSTKWGFGSGVSLFIAAGVGWRLFAGLFGFLGPENIIAPIGAIPAMVYNFLFVNNVIGGMQNLAAILATVIIFLLVVWAQSLKIEIPLSYDRLRGYGMKWPLNFFYASVIPVILAGALIANLQLFGGLLQNWLGRPTFLGEFVNGQAVSGLSFWLGSSNILKASIDGSLVWTQIIQAFAHILIFAVLAAVFSVFWVKTSGMDAQSLAKKILGSGLQIAGFRKDERILETILKRYVMPLTVMGGIAIGLLASVSDVLGTITGGTALLLGIMIMFQFYQNIAQQHQMDMNPTMRKFMGK